MPKSQLYVQARDQILALTREQKLKPGDQLPSETELGQTLGVSRNTIRDALMLLERGGVVVRQHGIGTFLAPSLPHLQTGLHQMLPIPELISTSGFKHQVRDLQVIAAKGPSQAHELLQVAPAELLQSISLLHLADKHPAVYITYWLSPSIGPDHLNWVGFDGHMVNFIERNTLMRVHHSMARIFAVSATKTLAERLNVKPNSPLLKMMHTAFNTNGQMIYCSTSYQDSNLLELTVVRQRL